MKQRRLRFRGSWMKTGLLTGMMVISWAIMWIGLAAGAEKSVAEEILDILKERGQITDTQYDELMKKAKAEREAKDKDFRVYWDKGIRMDSKDKKYKIKMGGRIQTDWGAIGADDDLKASFAGLEGTGAEFRRARLYIEGTVYDFIDFKAQYDFAGSDADFKDVYIGLKNVPLVGHIKVGHSKEPFSLEELTSSKYVTFMERALPNAFSPGRNTGIKFHNAGLNKRLTWGVGVFDDVDDTGDSDFDDFSDYNITARVTFLPWYAGGASLLHVGLSYSHQFRSEDNTNVRYRARPEAHMTDVRLVDTGSIPTDGVDLLTSEVAFVFGPLSFQGEYFLASLDSQAASDPSFSGFYAYVSYFLTGEHRKYSTSSGAFSRVSPARNFHIAKGGLGAWEVGLRYSHIDLNDEGISGGEQDNITVGLNWYLNPNVRVMFNYVYADLEDRAGFPDGDANIFGTRFQIDY